MDSCVRTHSNIGLESHHDLDRNTGQDESTFGQMPLAVGQSDNLRGLTNGRIADNRTRECRLWTTTACMWPKHMYERVV